MSDYVATLVLNEQRFLLIDYDRPVWIHEKFAASGKIPAGWIRVVPTVEHILADAIAGFEFGAFDGFAKGKEPLVVVYDVEEETSLAELRTMVYTMDTSALELLVPEHNLYEMQVHLDRFKHPIKVTIQHDIKPVRWDSIE